MLLSWRGYIPYKNPYTNNRAEQALLNVWKPRASWGMIGNEQRPENGIRIFQYMS